MKIDKIYYEELKSIYIDGKWMNKKVGIGASLDDENGQLSNRLDDLKVIARRELNRDDNVIKPDHEEKYKQLLKDTVKNIENEIELIEDDIPF